ncbi:MAG: phosphate ABC transporter substrate-binding protein [Nevskiales bacterium]
MSVGLRPTVQSFFISARIQTIFACLLLTALSPTGCSRSDAPASPQTRKLVLTGSSTIAPLIGEIAKRYEAAHPGVRIDVQTGGSSRGVSDARAGLADIGMASRALKDEEKDLSGYAIARDGIGVILHSANPVTALSDEQVVKIYTGEISNWKDAGGKDAPITVINKAEGRSTLELFLSYFKLKSEQVKASVIIGDNEQGIKTLAGNPDGIAYVSIGSAEYAATHGTPIKLLAMKGIAASIENVRNGSFPLSRPLTLVTKEAATGLKKDFTDYARSPAVHDLVQQLYFVPLE